MTEPKIKIKLLPPRYPNFVRIEYDGVGGETIPIPIGNLDDDDLEAYAEMWKQGLIAHAKSKREVTE